MDLGQGVKLSTGPDWAGVPKMKKALKGRRAWYAILEYSKLEFTVDHMTSIYSREYKRFLERFRQARKQAGLTQKDVAKHIGRDQSFISKCESGERRVDVVELQKFAEIYGKPLGFFTGRED